MAPAWCRQRQRMPNSADTAVLPKAASAQPSAPTVVIRPSRGWASLQLAALWEYRELLYFLVWRDVKVRYKQTVLGVLWIILQPVVSMVVFSALFGGLLNVPSGGVPYPIFLYSALLPWNYFSGSLTRSSASVVGSANLIRKVYFPRLVIPISGVVSGLVDFAVAFPVLAALMRSSTSRSADASRAAAARLHPAGDGDVVWA